jgi:hypothetical protein
MLCFGFGVLHHVLTGGGTEMPGAKKWLCYFSEEYPSLYQNTYLTYPSSPHQDRFRSQNEGCLQEMSSWCRNQSSRKTRHPRGGDKDKAMLSKDVKISSTLETVLMKYACLSYL